MDLNRALIILKPRQHKSTSNQEGRKEGKKERRKEEKKEMMKMEKEKKRIGKRLLRSFARPSVHSFIIS